MTDRQRRQKMAAYLTAKRYAREMNEAMMRLYIRTAREVDGKGLTANQLAQLERLLRESRVSAYGTTV